MLPLNNEKAVLAGRVWKPEVGPCVVRLEGGRVIDITSKAIPTMQALLERQRPADAVRAAPGNFLCTVDELATTSNETAGPDSLRLLAPSDLGAIKASGVTFAASMVERVIEEQAAGNSDHAAKIRARIGAAIGDVLSDITPGSPDAVKIKEVLQAEGLWSQYLEVGIGPDAEIFTKCQPMAAVGHGASVGIHPMSSWNNPEPEVVLAVNSRGEIIGATLGNDVNLRDVEGRSALLLGKAKDNNASAALGPFLRLFDEQFTLDDVRSAHLTMQITGEDGFTLEGASSMSEISRDPATLVSQTIGRHHQYPDGFFLYLGTMFAPVKDRDAPGQGFTHHPGDIVSISTPQLGTLTNTVRLSTEAPEWAFGTAALMRNLAGRGLL